MELQCMAHGAISGAQSATKFSSLRRDKYRKNFRHGIFNDQFRRYSPLQIGQSPLNFSRKNVLRGKLRCPPGCCIAQLPEVGPEVKHLVESLKIEIIANSFINGGKLLRPGVLENCQLLKHSILNLLQNVQFHISRLDSGPDVLKLGHSVVNILEVLRTHLTSQLGNLVAGIADDPEKFKVLAGQIGTALGAYPGKFSTVPVPLAGTAVATLAGSVILASASVTNKRTRSLGNGDALPLRYDPEAIAAYFERRPLDVVSRSFELVSECSYLAASLAIDRSTGMAKQNEKQRAAEVVDLITKLGPTAIKIGQALSIRPDILPVVYLEELQKLQDRVPPFPNEVAKQLIEEGLGRPVEEVLSELSSEPVAAASLGQVYKGTLKETGEVVAVKVQRPGVLEGISRDLFLLRTGAHALQSLPSVQSNLVALLDNWALRFFDELDYVQEAKNGEQFAENMKSLPNIKVPRVFTRYTSRKVLITEWVEGEKLCESRAGDLHLLVNTALNCYLMQLLESGFLHADPHPGNLLRTTDGCLCVLDYGLMTEVTEDQRYAFIEYISHLVNSDYVKVADDLVRLGFVPPDLVDPEKTVAVVPQLGRVLSQLTQGGGARKVNVEQVTKDLAKISEDYVFVIPPYFALIIKAFSILEGIGLEADPDYAIINDCYPYLSKRLITDDSPRARAALKYFLYGENDRLNVKRVEDILYGFETFRKLTAVPASPDNMGGSSSPIDPAAKEVLLLLFAPEGSFLQELLLTELVRAVDALSREALAELWRYIVSRALIPLPPALSAPKSWPIPLPSLFFGKKHVASLTQEDEQSLETVKRLWVIVEPQFRQGTSLSGIADLAHGVMHLMPDIFPGVITITQRFMLMLLHRQALRLADDLDGKDSIAEWERDPAAFARHVRPVQLPVLQRQILGIIQRNDSFWSYTLDFMKDSFSGGQSHSNSL